MTRIFIDGEAGTTGLQLAQRLTARQDLELLRIDPSKRKDSVARASMLASADIAVLCLPDDAAREAVKLAGDSCRILDASTVHRTADGWVYGLPEMSRSQRQAIAGAEKVANPGCYPQGFILLTRPLIEADLLSASLPLRVHALSGYSGGGRPMIEAYEKFDSITRERWNSRPYALSLQHKHVPEMQRYAGCTKAPLFAPTVGNYYQGMLVQLPLFRSELNSPASPAEVRELLADRYADEPFIDVLPTGAESALEAGFLAPTACNNSNRIELMVFGHSEQMLLVARYDNLGKGAAGAAVQNLNLMMGVEETTGLTG
jgi:N-acetyl-gamma-glutamyl-phosphate reductase